MRDQFIRFKDIPENEISGIYDGDLGKIKDEVGVSCYKFIKDGDNYNIILPSIDLGVVNDLQLFLDEFKYNKISCYLIEAEQVDLGNYGEPVVKNIKIISKLKRVELYPIKPKFKMDRTNPQLQIIK